MTRWLRRIATWIAVALLTVFVVRVVDSQRGAPLALWQTHVPPELHAGAIATASWADWLRGEAALLADVQANVSARLPAAQCTPDNRYCPRSPQNPARFAVDWNRSFVLEPAGTPAGVVVLLHGLTDSPYSLRHVAELYRSRGWLVVAIRMPGHGSVPAALTTAKWQDWRAATQLAVREARRRVPAGPLHIVGYSNGGALALDYAMLALGDAKLARPDRLVLISPMLAITGSARFAGIAGWPAVFPAFAKAAWTDLQPEYNPFKYNSFTVNAARESFRLTQVVQRGLRDHAADGSLARLPPVETFQSLVDTTVIMPAAVDALYNRLPANGSELVLFDVNRSAVFGPLLRPRAVPVIAALLPPAPRRYAVVVVGNAASGSAAEARLTPAGATAATVTPLGIDWPEQVFSLSHIALPFPVTDGLYGTDPDHPGEFGIPLGALAPRGERNVLIVSPVALLRLSSNPFYPWMMARIEAGIR